MKAGNHWKGSRDNSEWSYFEDGYNKAMEDCQEAMEKLLDVSKYTERPELIKTLITQTYNLIKNSNE